MPGQKKQNNDGKRTDLYFIAVVLPPEIAEGIRRFQQEFSEKYGSSHALKSPVHITLFPPFRMDESLETVLIPALKKMITGNTIPFSVQLKHFGSFRKDVVYVNVMENSRLTDLQLKISELMEKNFGFKGSTHGFHPHVTLANRDLEKEQFVKAWKEFEKREFELSFAVNGFSLLKHIGGWKEIAVIVS